MLWNAQNYEIRLERQFFCRRRFFVARVCASCQLFKAANRNLRLTQHVELVESSLHMFTPSRMVCVACALHGGEVLKTSPPYKAQVRKTVRDGKAWNSNSKAGNLNFLRAQRVGYAAQILETFTIVFSPYFGTNTDASRARTRVLHRSLYFLLSSVTPCFANVQMCRCANVQICKCFADE